MCHFSVLPVLPVCVFVYVASPDMLAQSARGAEVITVNNYRKVAPPPGGVVVQEESDHGFGLDLLLQAIPPVVDLILCSEQNRDTRREEEAAMRRVFFSDTEYSRSKNPCSQAYTRLWKVGGPHT
jgi:hypothetical protein